MIKKIKKKLIVIKNLNWIAAWKYYKKRLTHQFYFLISIIKGKKYWIVNIDGTEIKLSFSHPYQHSFARGLSFGDYGGHERILMSLWKHQAEHSGQGMIFDFGGYNGIYGLLAAKVNPEAEVVIIEADPVNFRHIQENISLNGLKNATAKNLAVAEHSGPVYFRIHEGATGGGIADFGGLKMQAASIDELIGQKTPLLMKFDINGAEIDALMSAGDLLAKTGRLGILLEFYPKVFSAPEQEKEFWSFLKSRGFHPLYLYPRGDGGAIYYYVFKGDLK